MTLRDLLVERRAALCERWLDALLADYGGEAAMLWRRQKDPFANPVGHTFSEAAPHLLEALAGEESSAAAAAVEALVEIRSIQELAPSRAVSFFYKWRDVIRAEVASGRGAELSADELEALDRRVERLTLAAVDVYVRCRERIFRLRQDELKRSVATLLRRWDGGGDLPEPPHALPILQSPGSDR